MISVGSMETGANHTHCIPLVSEYSDCSDDNACTGCSKCSCTAEGKWSCEIVSNCPGYEEGEPPVEDDDLDNVINAIQYELKSKKDSNAVKLSNNHPLVPGPTKYTEDIVLESKRKFDDDFLNLLARGKRSIKEPEAAKKNSTIKFYEAIDEINEDTLKNSNMSGTININKMEVANKLKTSRRTAVTDDNNNSSLKINYNDKLYDAHITDNKVETNYSEDKVDALGHEKLHEITGNISVQMKNKDLSKIVVNELVSGTEYIGDKNAPVMSNITFKPENDTLTAMTFIAGNLLNKLWNMEKDSSGENLETEILKHEKIANLIELFREPLSLRQETFLKNALEHLSNAINNNKDVKNVSLCANIEEATRLLKPTFKQEDEVRSIEEGILRHASEINMNESEKESLKTATTAAVSKINNVLNLMKKFEGIQKTLGDLRTLNKSDIVEGEQIDPLTRDENSVLSVYGNVLEKITKLIMPEKNTKKISNKIRNTNLQGVNKKIKDLLNIDVGKEKFSAKDKLIFEYITHMENNPDCLLNDKRDKLNVKSTPKVEGILLNLSEFFKIKSFVDLLKVVEPAKASLRVSVDTTVNPIPITSESVTVANLDNEKLMATKEKLKAHLKTIVEDLIEMQNTTGSSDGSQINLADVMPCIYNILNDVGSKDNKKHSEVENVISIFESLKTEMKSPQTRRSDLVTEERPKSVVVWERVVKNLNKNQKLKTRRSSNAKQPKSFKDLKKIMDGLESYGPNTYKNLAFFTEVHPADQLVLLKTLDADSKRYMNILEYIKISIDAINDFSLQERKDIDEFIENAERNIKLNEKVVKALNNKKNNNLGAGDKNQLVKPMLKAKPSFKVPEATLSDNKMKVVTRDEIIHQLIKNRMLIYIKMKEAKGEVINDLNYNIAKKILAHLENGNYSIAREMYKLFVSQKQMNAVNTPDDRLRASSYGTENIKSQPIIIQKQPLIQFEDPKINQEHLLKQLLNIKNMRI